MFRIGQVAWNKGLTKEIDIRVKKCADAKVGKKRIFSERHRENLSKAGRGKPRPELRGKRAWNRGLTKMEDGRICGGREKGCIVWNKGKTKETDERMQKVTGRPKGIPSKFKGMPRSDKDVRAIIRASFKRPTSFEKKIIDLTIEYNTGDIYNAGENGVIIKGKNPDFINDIDRRIIEVCGEYWHKDKEKYEQERLDVFSPFGYRVVFIWGEDLKREDWKEHCLNKILSVESRLNV